MVRCYPADLAGQLPELPEFRPAHVTAEAAGRRLLYRTEWRRRQAEEESGGDRRAFLASLDLVMEIAPATEGDLARASELTVRTHQLNSTGLVYGEEDLRRLIAAPDHQVRLARLSDRFGDYGVVGLSVTELTPTESVLRLMLMSCRVASRGAGELMLSHTVRQARAEGRRPVTHFVPTAVNRTMLVTLRFAGYAPVTRDAGDGAPMVLEVPADYPVRGTGAAGQGQGTEAAAEGADVTAGRADGAPAPSVSLLDAFLAQADRTPRATALVIGDTVLRYRELADASAGLAARLRAAGARPGTTVCLRLEQSAVAVVAVLAALRVGAAWAALEPDLPEARLRALLHDTDCAVVIGGRDDRTLTRLPDTPSLLPAEDLDLTALAEAGTRTAASAAPPVPENTPAYLIYTSGSSGPPKGVVVTRRQLADSVRPRGTVYGTAPSVFLMAMRLSFDGMLAGMFWSFSHGHTLLLPTARELRLAPEFTRLAHRHRATHLIVVPSLIPAAPRRLRAAPGQPPGRRRRRRGLHARAGQDPSRAAAGRPARQRVRAHRDRRLLHRREPARPRRGTRPHRPPLARRHRPRPGRPAARGGPRREG